MSDIKKQPLFEDIAPTDFLKFSFGAKPYEAAIKTEIAKTETLCGVRAFVVEHEGLKYVRADMDFKVFGGSLGCAEGEKLTLAFEYATANKLGIVISTRSGGVRMQEGTVALMMMAKVSVAAAAHKKAGLPFITLFEDPTYGGVSASYAMQADVRIGIRGARIGFAGPGVILNTMYNQKQNQYDRACPSGFQSAQFLYEHGQLDLLVGSEAEAINLVEQIFNLLINTHKDMKPKELPALSEEEQFTTKRVIEQKDFNRGRMLDRIQAQDICFNVLEDYVELNGDGKIGTDSCIHGGLARLPICCESCCKKGEEEKEEKKCHCGRTVVVIGTFKAHTQGEFASMGYGMATPHGYRAAYRLFELAEHFNIPCVTLVDTVGAEPSFAAETEGQSEAISSNLRRMSSLKVPLLTCILGEGGSGGAIGLGMGNSVSMFSSAWYGVISPEGAASILGRYKDDKHKAEQFPKDAAELAKVQQIYADQLLEKGTIDGIIWEEEDLGRKRETYMEYPQLKKRLVTWLWTELEKYDGMSQDALVEHRYNRFRKMGPFLKLDPAIIAKFKEEEAAKPAVERPPRKASPEAPKFVKYLCDLIMNAPQSQFKSGKTASFQTRPCLPSEQSTKVLEEYNETLTSEQKELTKENAKSILDAKGPNAVKDWIMANREKRVLVTDTTLRDAHQSLLATRMRTNDMVGAADEMSKVMNNAFSLEMWGGATFDVALRFLKEDPWERVRELRKRIPNVCFQALLRGSNVVGYTNYPDNAVEEFCRVAAEAGIDVFRIFDCFNDVEKMKSATKAVIKANKIAEVCICYTSDFMDPNEKIYTLDYYASLAKEIEGIGAHILGIKDMAGLLKPQNAEPFMKKLREVTNLPIHFHTHNTSGNALATCLMMAQHGCEIIDLAISSMSDLTSQPSLNAFLAATERSPRPALIPFRAVEPLASYFGVVRSYYQHLESGQLASTARVYDHEIPGGQYSNLLMQSKALNIWDKWDQALDMYRDCNKILGNLIKVTPSSKCVGDLALFLLGKGLTTKDVMEGKIDITYPESVKGLFKGNLGYPHHWREPFQLSPEFLALRDRVLKGEKIRGKEEALPPIDFGKLREMLNERLKREPTDRDVISHIMYPPVFEGYLKFVEQFGTMATFVPTPVFFYGMEVGQKVTIRVPAERIDEDLKAVLSLTPSSSSVSSSTTPSDAKSGEMVELNVELARITPIDADSTRKVIIKVNGVEFVVKTEAKLEAAVVGTKADLKDKTQFAAPMPGIVSEIKVATGDTVKKGQVIGKITAMKMDVMLEAPFDGKVMGVLVKTGNKVLVNTLLFKIVPLE
ncbi:malonyl-CoA:pyruvate transcarboxylase [Monocercomonoides exilis]|uniref:malonyl-CoA:pyruvate transcarboxylase n=1 Tax=Monocercomonoides exilis TaxID=2049356 RepID=UPI00355A534D|nr:malonyl-CoA:pyruvate transcarboxylase [Monocercomonoides exilis]|eukprot:MONOS_7463.1-p1 / transcript=MONOS_7463.1 / gene=MONOS_7463 / organism=Monocercomonoides_exilis_PA203 / gene_product=putative malonyl-CoA:pyruvate transcarboxylase / transcript_product=putative malonyl-CoA:pyruvate transcarboxylase / location=Mono_scaffold00255:71135-75151(-) / protein_length=1317 / sequence_SO=supercontig / SO=protein_coding / is_pseudo=false